MTGPLEELDRIVRDEQSRFPIPGLSIGIIDGNDEFTAAFGVTNVEHPLAVTPDTFFQIGSITKTFLATLVARLVDEGTLDLDVPVRRWVADLRLRDESVAARVTLRQLLTHTAGWFGDHFLDVGSDDDALARYVESMADLEQQVPLGTVWAYNNAAFSLAGRVVELVTERPIEHAMRDLLLVPLGLERAHFFAHEVITHRVVAGHHDVEGSPQVARPWSVPRVANCIGGIVTTIHDLLAYARFHMGDGMTFGGARYLSEPSLRLMVLPLVPAALGQHRGLAWTVDEVQGVRLIGHGGATIGQQALLWIAPAGRFAVAMLTNSSAATQLANAIVRWSFERYLGIRRDPPRTMSFDPEIALRVAGTYRSPANELRVALEDGALVLHQRPLEASFRRLMRNPPPIPKPAPLGFSRSDRMMLLDGPLKDGQIEILGPDWVRFSGRLYRRDATSP